jgi:hypothetical protein
VKFINVQCNYNSLTFSLNAQMHNCTLHPTAYYHITDTGGILGVDGCIYAPPYTATGVLRIDPRTDTVQVLGNFPYGGYKWHGGLLAKSTGVIYAFPAHSNEVLCIDTNVDRRHRIDEKKENDDDNDGARVVDEESESLSSWRVSTIPIHRHENDTDSPDLRYKWRK